MKLFIAVLIALASVSASADPMRKVLHPQLTGPQVSQGDLTDEQVSSSVRAYLGAIDTRIPADRWRALGSRAEAALLEVAGGAVLPTRRAKAIDALSVVGTSHTELFTKVAGDESEPFVVRYAAMRTLGTLLPTSDAVTQLTPMLTSAKDVRVRAAAGAVLAFRAPKQACGAVQAQIGREAKADRAQFGRAMDACFAQ